MRVDEGKPYSDLPDWDARSVRPGNQLDIHIELENDTSIVPSWCSHWDTSVRMHFCGSLFEVMLESDSQKIAHGAYQVSYNADELRSYLFQIRSHQRSGPAGHDYRQSSASQCDVGDVSDYKRRHAHGEHGEESYCTAITFCDSYAVFSSSSY